MNGNLNGVASDAWTDTQVATRRAWAVEDLLTEWETNGSAVEENAAMLGSAAGQGIGVGLIFAAYINGVARQPEAQGRLQSIAILGFALAEALAIIGIALAFVL